MGRHHPPSHVLFGRELCRQCHFTHLLVPPCPICFTHFNFFKGEQNGLKIHVNISARKPYSNPCFVFILPFSSSSRLCPHLFCFLTSVKHPLASSLTANFLTHCFRRARRYPVQKISMADKSCFGWSEQKLAVTGCLLEAVKLVLAAASY